MFLSLLGGMHYILLDDEDMRIDYLFIDEAHKISR